LVKTIKILSSTSQEDVYLLGYFGWSRKAPVSFFSYLSIRFYRLGSHWADFRVLESFMKFNVRVSMHR